MQLYGIDVLEPDLLSTMINQDNEMNEERCEAATADVLLSVLGQPQRFEIVQKLSRSPANVSKLARELDLGMETVSQNLKRLKRFGLVTMHKAGNFRIYRMSERVRIRKRGSRVSIAVRAKDDHLVFVSYPAAPPRE